MAYYHTFDKSVADASKCRFCGLSEDEHKCVTCDSSLVTKYIDFALCEIHYTQEIAAQKELEATADARVAEVSASHIPEPDSSIQVSTDIFNAHIASIEEIRKAVESDTNIQEGDDKKNELARRLEARYLHLKSVISQAQDEIKNAQSETRAIQTYYNELAKKLKEEVRKQIQIQDVKYTPPEKPVKKVKTPTVKKSNKKEIREVAGISGIPEQILTIICLQRNCTPKDAVQFFRQAQSDNGK